jgi:hypothetical protein
VHTNYIGSSSTGIKCPFREESTGISAWIKKKGMKGNRGNGNRKRKGK